MINIHIVDKNPIYRSVSKTTLNKIKEIMEYKIKKEDRLNLIVDAIMANTPSISERIQFANVDESIERHGIAQDLLDLHLEYAEEEKKDALDLLSRADADPNDVCRVVSECIQEELKKRAKIYTDVYNRKERLGNNFKHNDIEDFLSYLRSKKDICMAESVLAKNVWKLKSLAEIPTDNVDVDPEMKEHLMDVMNLGTIFKVVQVIDNILSSQGFEESNPICEDAISMLLIINVCWSEIKEKRIDYRLPHYNRMLECFQKAYDWRLSLEEQVAARREIEESSSKDKMLVERDEDVEITQDSLTDIQSADSDAEKNKRNIESFLIFFSILRSFMYLIFGVYHSCLHMIGSAFSKELRFKMDAFFVLNMFLCFQSVFEALYRNINLTKRKNVGTMFLIKNSVGDLLYLVMFLVLISVLINAGFPVFIQRYSIYMVTSIMIFFTILFALIEMFRTVRKVLLDREKRKQHISDLIGQVVSLSLTIYFHFLMYEFVVFEKTKLLNFLC